MSEDEKKDIYQNFCLDLVDRYLDELGGNGKNDEYIIGKRPTEKIAIGILDSGYDDSEIARYLQMRMIKVQFYVNSNPEGNIRLNLKGNLYYNVVPTYEEEKKYIEDLEEERKKKNLTDVETEEQKIFEDYKIVQKFKRIKVDEIVKDICFSKKDLLKKKEIDFSDELNKKLYDNIDLSDAVFFDSRVIQNNDVLETKEKYEEFIKQNTHIFKAKINWQFSGIISLEKIKDIDKYIVTVIIRNITEKSQDYYAKDFETDKYCIPLYNCGIEIAAENNLDFETISLENFDKSYKVDSKIKAKGEWLSAECVDNKIITKNIPKYIEMRLLTNDSLKDNTNFKNLQSNPIENLNIIFESMKEYYNTISSVSSNDEEYLKDVKKFKYELKRFKRGVDILSSPDFECVLKSFILMNKTFENNSYSGWRLFQLVFIVSMISDIVYNDNKDLLKSELYNYSEENEAEIIFFPTGGGKTEAFLGTVVLSCFYDRLSGKEYGVNTIIKYPLRLLSIQQLERTFNVLVKANEVMKNYDELKNSIPFSIGYFVGSSNTPNKINEDKIEEIYNHKNELTLINKCPKCGSSVEINYNYETKILEHKCSNCSYVLPLYIVDDDIYRFLPTVIISTVDKMASISFKDEFRNILGLSKFRCPKHGFTYNKKCLCDINDKVIDIYENQKSSLSPTLFIQDEIHLLKESLGVFSSHYESLMEYIINDTNNDKFSKKIKYIGATATISGAEYLVKEVYGKECRIFPSPSTSLDGSSFYAYKSKKDISRIILGYAPFGDALNPRVEYSVSLFRKMLYDMYNNPEMYNEKYNLTVDDFKKMVFHYWTTIIYTRSKKENNNLRNTFEQQANNRSLSSIPEAHFNIVRMTGDEDFSQIKSSLSNMEFERDKTKANNLVLATSTISHGVDSKDFNNIFFYGVPSNTAEYIQSYSRVGRTYTGVVIDIIRLAQNRDVSFLKYFNMIHKYKDYLISENRLTSKSIAAMKHTLPGIFVSVMKHHFAFVNKKTYDTVGQINEFLLKDGKANIENCAALRNVIHKIYRCENISDNNSLDSAFKDRLDFELYSIIKNLNEMIDNGLTHKQKISENISLLTNDGYRPMTSLRDVDRTYEIGIIFGGDLNEEE